MAERHPVWLLLDGVQMDVRELEKRSRELAAKIVQLRSFVAGLGLGTGPGPEVCEECGLGRGQHLASCSRRPIPSLGRPNPDAEARRLNAKLAARLARGAAAEREES